MSRLPNRRVVITGLGVISPLGNTYEELWHGLTSRASGVAESPQITALQLPTRYAAEAWHFKGEIGDFGELEGEQKKTIRKGLKVMCRESQLGVAAAQRALRHAGFCGASADPERCGVSFGSDYMLCEPAELGQPMATCLNDQARFDFKHWGSAGMKHLTPLWLLKYLPNMPASHIAIYNDLRGPNNSLTQREASSGLAVGEGFRIIQRGHADMMLAGATGTRIHPLKAVQTSLEEPVAAGDRPPAEVSRPFDRGRSGMVLGEGAGAIVLEELEHALRRGAKIFGEVIAAASSSVVNRQRVAQRDVALANALRAALREAGIDPQAIGHIHAHGLSTPSCDVDEATALQAVLGETASRVPVVASKANLGNVGAAGGMLELIASLLALQANRLFPTLNYDEPDPECPLAVNTADDTAPGEVFICQSVTPVGQASCLIVRRWADV